MRGRAAWRRWKHMSVLRPWRLIPIRAGARQPRFLVFQKPHHGEERKANRGTSPLKRRSLGGITALHETTFNYVYANSRRSERKKRRRLTLLKCKRVVFVGAALRDLLVTTFVVGSAFQLSGFEPPSASVLAKVWRNPTVRMKIGAPDEDEPSRRK